MTSHLQLLKAIRSGQLADVVSLLDSGASAHDEAEGGEPGMLLGVACFMGHVDIVRELIRRGAVANLPDNAVPTSPLSMAVRAGHREVVRTLVEFGAQVPEGMATGLSAQELTVAGWIAFRNGLAQPADGHDDPHHPVVEEIELTRFSGTDTLVLEADLLRQQKDGG